LYVCDNSSRDSIGPFDDKFQIDIRRRNNLNWNVNIDFGGILMRHWQNPQEWEIVQALVQGISPRLIIEIGSLEGGTLSTWFSLSPRVISVDRVADGDVPEETRQAQMLGHSGAWATLAMARKCSFRGIYEDSHEMATRIKVWEALLCLWNLPDYRSSTRELPEGPPRADMLFIDGDHSYEGVKQDFEMYGPLVRPGGMILFHDAQQLDGQFSEGVPRFWKELKESTAYPCIEITHGDASCGTGGIIV
jgi:hypothetical protein